MTKHTKVKGSKLILMTELDCRGLANVHFFIAEPSVVSSRGTGLLIRLMRTHFYGF